MFQIEFTYGENLAELNTKYIAPAEMHVSHEFMSQKRGPVQINSPSRTRSVAMLT